MKEDTININGIEIQNFREFSQQFAEINGYIVSEYKEEIKDLVKWISLELAKADTEEYSTPTLNSVYIKKLNGTWGFRNGYIQTYHYNSKYYHGCWTRGRGNNVVWSFGKPGQWIFSKQTKCGGVRHTNGGNCVDFNSEEECMNFIEKIQMRKGRILRKIEK